MPDTARDALGMHHPPAVSASIPYVSDPPVRGTGARDVRAVAMLPVATITATITATIMQTHASRRRTRATQRVVTAPLSAVNDGEALRSSGGVRTRPNERHSKGIPSTHARSAAVGAQQPNRRAPYSRGARTISVGDIGRVLSVRERSIHHPLDAKHPRFIPTSGEKSNTRSVSEGRHKP